jgi:hypothetical protein
MSLIAISILICLNIFNDNRLKFLLNEFESFSLNIKLSLKNDQFKRLYIAIFRNDIYCSKCRSFRTFLRWFFFIIIEDDNDCICSMKKLIATFRSRKIWKMSCIFIDCNKFNWQAFFNTFLILYDSIHLWFNFLEERSIFMFLMNNHISFSTTYLNDAFLVCVMLLILLCFD